MLLRVLPLVLEQVHQFLHVAFWVVLRLLLPDHQLQHQHVQIILLKMNASQKNVRLVTPRLEQLDIVLIRCLRVGHTSLFQEHMCISTK